MHFLPNGNAFVGWATRSQISEHSPSGQLLMTALFKTSHGGSYRTYKQPWVGRPAQPPDVKAVAAPTSQSSTNLTTVVHVSWNGATEVDTWTLYHSNRFGNITQQIAVLFRKSFETKFVVAGYPQHIQIVAKDRQSQEIGRSDVIPVELSPDLHTPAMAAADHQWVVEHSSEIEADGPMATAAADASGGFFWFFVGCFCSITVCGIVLMGWMLRKRGGVKRPAWQSKEFEYSEVNVSDLDE